jgi:hypothetical protein
MESINRFKSLLNYEYDGRFRAQPSVSEDDIFELRYDGKITKLFEPDFPINIGYFEMDVLNLRGARRFGKFDSLIDNTIRDEDHIDGTYVEANHAIEAENVNLDNVDRIVFLKNVIVHPNYRGKDILPELIKSVYLTHYTRNTLFMALAKPIQSIPNKVEEMCSDYYDWLQVDGNKKSTGEIADREKVNIGKYYKLDTLPEEDEGHYYKLYAKLTKLNMSQMGNTSFFCYKTENDILEMIELNKFKPIFLF